jgi:hypothetical protein
MISVVCVFVLSSIINITIISFQKSDADFKPLWYQIKEDIDQSYSTSDDNISSLSVNEN